jgi:predicted TPR repeat methyltransferase
LAEGGEEGGREGAAASELPEECLAEHETVGGGEDRTGDFENTVRGDIAAAIATYERFLELNTDPRRERIADAKLRRMRAKLRGTQRTEPVKATGVM